jgi:hemin uptake protein HemP
MTFHTPTDFTHARPAPIPLHRAQDLTKGGVLAQIDLDGQIYALRITRAGKLILTK